MRRSSIASRSGETARAAAALVVCAIAGCQLFSGIDDLQLRDAADGPSCLQPSPASPPGIGAPTECPPDLLEPGCEQFCCESIHEMGCEAQWPSIEACFSVCSLWPTAGDSGLGCHDLAAAMGNCGVSGPLGHGDGSDSGCGNDACENFCELQGRICGFRDSCGLAPVYDSLDECEDTCGDYAEDPAYDRDQTSGDSLACRTYWLVQAAAATSLEQLSENCAESALGSTACD